MTLFYYRGQLSPDFYGWVFPHGTTLSIGTGSAEQGFSLRTAARNLRQAANLADIETIRHEGAPIPMKPLPRWDNGRDVVLAGDAAGVVAPASGEGIYAMTGGRLAADAVESLLPTGNVRSLAMARKRFMKAHGKVFCVLALFTLNGLLNVLWSLLYFRLHRPDWALVEVVPLWLSILLLIMAFASWLLTPYLVWVTFAANLISRLLLMLAVRNVLGGAWWGWTAASGVAHATDLWRRWQHRGDAHPHKPMLLFSSPSRGSGVLGGPCGRCQVIDQLSTRARRLRGSSSSCTYSKRLGPVPRSSRMTAVRAQPK